MSDSLWDIDAIQDEQRALSDKEREYLMTGDPGSYTYADMDRRVAGKAEKLPERFQQFIDDVCLLHHGEALDEEAISDLWDDFVNVSNRSQLVRDSPVLRMGHESADPERDLGFEIGSLIRLISEDSLTSEFVWGLIIGVLGEPQGEYNKEADQLVQLFDELEKKYELRLVSAGSRAQEDDGFHEERQEIRDILQHEGFAPAPPLVDAVLTEYTENGSNEVLAISDKSWRADPDQTEHPTPPDEIPSSEEMRRTSLEMIVHKFDEESRLRDIDRLAKQLREDAVRIQNREWRGVDPDQALQFVAENGETQIQEFDQTEPQGQNNMTTALRRLSYKDSTWVNQPVLYENQGENTYWELTPYGDLLYKVRLEHNCSTNWMYNSTVESKGFDENIYKLLQ